ncbi:MAG: sulfite exporter TauE/SafE family protein [Sedimentisphaerales bacterium]|nr:sulfite exporter TauE/SafE family protein [Sedimentisphaerales bacterium]
MEWLWLTSLALVAGVLSALTGFGGAAILLPALVLLLGPRDAVVTLTVAQLCGNLSRVWFNRTELDWRVVRWFAFGAVPASVAGGLLFATAPLRVLTVVLGVALIGMVVGRRLMRRGYPKLGRRGFAGLGAGVGTVSALVGTAGPIAAPFFLGYGLVRGAYIGTEAATAVIMHLVKSAVYGATDVMDLRTIGIGLLLGLVLLVGAYIGKRIVDRTPERVFVVLVELALIAAGIRLIWAA